MGKKEALTDRLIHAQDHTAGFHSRLDGIYFHQRRLPYESLHVVPHAFIIEIHTRPYVPLAMLHSELRQYIGRIKTSIITQLSWDDLQCFGERFDDCLLLPWDIRIGILMQEGTDLHLACTSAGHDGVVADGTLNDHDGVVKTAFSFGDELLGASAEDKGTCFGGRTAFEEIKSFAANLTLFEFLAGAKVLRLNIGACG